MVEENSNVHASKYRPYPNMFHPSEIGMKKQLVCCCGSLITPHWFYYSTFKYREFLKSTSSLLLYYKRKKMWDPDPLLFTAFGRIRIHFYPRSGSTLISFPGARIVVDPRIRNHYYRKVDPRIRIHFSQMWIQGSGSGFMSKWGWSKMLKIFF